MCKVNTKGPIFQEFLVRALAGVPKEWGDGSIIAALQQILEMIMPYIMNCFPSKSRFARNRFIAVCQRMGQFRQNQIHELCQQAAPRVDGLLPEDEAWGAEAAANGAIETLPYMSAEQLGQMFDELHAA
ncbi:hypothetical protein [Petrachloros mirabilis]